jgi:hypothetical protein
MRRVDSGPETPSERIAAALREAPASIDDFARARLERNVVDAWRGSGARAVSLPARAPTRTAWLFTTALSAAAGVALALWTLHEPVGDAARTAVAKSSDNLVAHFELVIDDGAVQSGYLSEGQVLESGKHGRIEVGLAQSRVDIAPDSRVRFERLSPSEVRLALVTGRVEVAFHPEHKGRDQLSIETRAARVIVVGTRFEVVANSAGDTTVVVSEGVVQVVPRRGGTTRFVRAGERLEVPVDDAGLRERELRASIEARLDAEREVVDLQDATAVSSGAGGDAVAASREPGRVARRDDGSSEQKLEAARDLLMHGKHAAARDRLQKLARSSAPTGARVEALTLIAESFTAQGQIPRASDAYREAVRIAPRHPAGYNALFALARLLERYTDDRGAAGIAYRDYLVRAPSGALAPQAREALCRLGDAASCR